MGKASVNQNKSRNRGSSVFTESWNYDGTGNWLQYNKNGTITNQTHNAANEVATNCTHDKNGNMTVMPGLIGKYDAWNRLVEVRNASNVLLATYAYNGVNQRIKKTASGVVTTSFFNEHWQELESKTSEVNTYFVWGTRYIDDLILREKGQEKLYALHDPNWNVVAITNATGVVQERMKYDGFGKITWMNASFGTLSASAYAWNRTFTGQVLDSETGLMLYRNRYYNTGLGRFVTRDPIGYRAGDNSLYRYVGNRTVNFQDEFGLQTRQSIDPNKQGVKGQGRESKNKSRQNPNWKPHNSTPTKDPPRHTPAKPHRKGFIDIRLLKGLTIAACETACANWYKNCLDDATSDYETCLAGAYSMLPALRKDSINLCDKIWALDATACGTGYAACGLACLCPFSLF